MADVLEKIKEQINFTPEMQEKFTSMMNKFRELDDDGKVEFLNTVKESLTDTVSKLTPNFWMSRFWMLSRSYVVLFVAILALLCVFVFFGYKLYTSLVERERKREEKRKLKQLKKKK